jgi:hypothetical protein
MNVFFMILFFHFFSLHILIFLGIFTTDTALEYLAILI